MATSPPDVIAAGAVITRNGGEVLLVHRPKYDDWSFPKGKLDPGEHVTAAAVREVAEETGLDVRLGPPLPVQRYWVDNGERRLKRVYYWVGRVVGDDDVSTYRVNDEIDGLAWLPADVAHDRLDYDYDRTTLAAQRDLRTGTTPLLVLRHARAHSRKDWSGDDRDRPLTDAGEFQAEQAVPVLEAYGVTRVLTSSSRRCWQSVGPYAEMAGVDLEDSHDLSEEDATPDRVAEQVRRLVESRQPSVLCTHRPVLPWVFDALGVKDRPLDKGSVVVVHHRRGEVVAVEQHDIGFR